MVGQSQHAQQHPSQHEAWLPVIVDQASTDGHRAEEKGGLREFHAARVNVVLKEIDEGLKMHKSCPSLLKNALAHEVVRGAYAIA